MSLISRIAYDWAERCFGFDHVSNYSIRALRTLEESLELSQSLGVSRELAHKSVDAVYDRPVGEPQQEMGGVLHTMNILCESMGLEPNEIAERELRRCLKKSPEHFAKRNQDKLDLGLDVSAQSLGDPPHTADAYADIAEHYKAGRAQVEADMDLDARAAKLYQQYADNHPTIHSNRFPAWSEIAHGDQDIWREKARNTTGDLVLNAAMIPANQPQTGDGKSGADRNTGDVAGSFV